MMGRRRFDQASHFYECRLVIGVPKDHLRNYLIDIVNAVIIDVEPTPARHL